MENNKIKVSVIMPVYNSGEYLKTAVDSILSQSLKEIELILVDDGSTDGSSERCDEYAAKDSRVVVIHQKNGGICNARNAALKIAKGEYIGFSDHDDEYVPGYLEHAYREAVNNKSDLVKVGKKEYIYRGDRLVRVKQSCLPYRVYHQEDIPKEYFNLVDADEMDCVWDSLIRKEIFYDNNLWFNENLKHGGEDIELMQRLIPLVHTFVTIDVIYYKHYIRRGFSTSTKWNLDTQEVKRMLMNEMINTMQALDIDIAVHQFDYTYQLLRQYIAPRCAFYANERCSLSNNEKRKALNEVRNMRFWFPFCDKQSVIRAWKKSHKYGMLYFLFKHRLYNAILFLYRMRLKNN